MYLLPTVPSEVEDNDAPRQDGTEVCNHLMAETLTFRNCQEIFIDKWQVSYAAARLCPPEISACEAARRSSPPSSATAALDTCLESTDRSHRNYVRGSV